MAQANVHGLEFNYEVFGEGEPVLLVCGTGQQSFTWQLFQVPALQSAGYRVVTFDNRGIAPSACPPAPYTVKEMAEDAAGLIEELDLAPCRVAGLSLGAFITQELALAHPELVRSAVIMGTLGRSDVFRTALIQAWVEMAERDLELPRIVEAVQVAMEVYSPAVLSNDVLMQQYLDFQLQMPRWENPGRLGQMSADQDYGRGNRLDAFREIRVPSMVIGFELDMLTAAPLSKEVAEAIPGCRYEEIPMCGHAGPLEQPEAVNALLLDFFARH